MKIKIGPYKSWFGPYQIAEKILFWKNKHEDEIVFDFGKWLAEDKNGNDTWLTKLCVWIDSKRKRKVKIHIDEYDIWSMDRTLAMIILPMLQQLQKAKHGASFVDPKDVPENLRPTQKPCDDNGYVDDTHFDRWDWILDELIWTFEQLQPENDWESQYYSGQHDFTYEPTSYDENGKPTSYKMKRGPNDTFKVDKKALKEHQKRIRNGLRLFGKYYYSLWD